MINKKYLECPDCGNTMTVFTFRDSKTGVIEVDYIMCEYCGHREVTPPIDYNKFREQAR